MTFSPADVLDNVRRALPSGASGRLCVAFSGGLDSTVLLTALAKALCDDPSFQVVAVHIDHCLHADASLWEQRCASIARDLGVEYQCRRVSVPRDSEDGLEAAARRERYEALRNFMRPGDALLTAHHADDQFETLMLALLRGAGLGGLSAMPVCREFSPGWHLRPLLGYSRQMLEGWARDQGLTWIADPSNDSRRFDRNFLRHDVLPLLGERWPGAAATAARSASHVAEGAELLDDLARIDLAPGAAGPCLRVDVLASLTAPRRRNLLRYWLKLRGARPPSTRKLFALEHDMLAAQQDRQPVVEWDGFEVRRFRGLLYANRTRPLPEQSAEPMEWDWTHPVTLPDHMGALCTAAGQGVGLARSLLPSRLRVDFRQGGEVMQPAGDLHHRSLKKLLQDADILPWWRNRLPLLWAGDRLAAVGDLWMAEEFSAAPGAESVRVIWRDRPPILAQSPDR